MTEEDKIVQEALDEAEAGRMASVTPLPGPLRDVFAPCPDIKVGPHVIRPVYDADLETLCAWDHPFSKWLVATLAGKEGVEEFVPRGADAWALFWVFTHPVEELDALAALPDGKVKLYEAAAKQFRRLTMPQAVKLAEAVMRQVGALASTGVGYGEKTDENTTERADPASPAAVRTASAGLSRSARG